MDKCKAATQLFSNMLCASVKLRRMDFMNDDGSIEEIEDPRTIISMLHSEVHQKRQPLIEQKKDDSENKKTMQALSKQDLDSVKIPDLYISAGGNNICQWIDATWEKFTYVKRHNPQVLQSLLKTVINKSGPLGTHIMFKRSMEDIYSSLVSLHLQGTKGLEILFDIKNVASNTCLESRQSLKNIETFERMVKVIQRMKILKNSTGELVDKLANWMFLYPDYQNWIVVRAKNVEKSECDAGLKKMYSINQTLLEDPGYDVLGSDDSGDEENYDLNNTMFGAKKGLASGCVDTPYRDMLTLVKFAGKVKEKQKARIAVTNEDQLKSQAKAEAKLKDVHITSKNVSYRTDKSDAVAFGGKTENSAKEKNKYGDGYKAVKKAFPQVRNAGSNVKRYVGGISRPNRMYLQLSKNASKLKECPCNGNLCTFAFQCGSFKNLHLAQKISFCKKENLCRNCLISHKGVCKFVNRHKCPGQDEKDPHHAFLCPDRKNERSVGGVCMAKQDLSEYSVMNTLNILEELNIDPQELSQALGRDVYRNSVFNDRLNFDPPF